MVAIANQLLSPIMREYLARVGDVPSVLTHERKKLPLGRYLKSELRWQVRKGGVPLYAPNQSIPSLERKAQMHALQAAFEMASGFKVPMKNAIAAHYQGRVAVLESSLKLSRGRNL